MDDAKHVHLVRLHHKMDIVVLQLSVEVHQFSEMAYVNSVALIQDQIMVFVASLYAQLETLLTTMEAANSVKLVRNQTALKENAVAFFQIVEHSRDMTAQHSNVYNAQIGKKVKTFFNIVLLTLVVQDLKTFVMVLANNVRLGFYQQIT